MRRRTPASDPRQTAQTSGFALDFGRTKRCGFSFHPPISPFWTDPGQVPERIASRLLRGPTGSATSGSISGARTLRRNAKNRHTRGRKQSKRRAMRPRRPAHAFHPGNKNAGMVFGNRFSNGIGRIAVLHKAMHLRCALEPDAKIFEAGGTGIHAGCNLSRRSARAAQAAAA